MENVRIGIWTPSSYVGCEDCDDHSTDNHFGPAEIGDHVDSPQWGDDGRVTTCSTCGRSIVVRSDVALQHNLMLQLRDRMPAGWTAAMWQTGGMCANLAVCPFGSDDRYFQFADAEEEIDQVSVFYFDERGGWDSELACDGVEIGLFLTTDLDGLLAAMIEHVKGASK